MPCPSCVATVTTEMSHRATLSYRLCADGGRPGAGEGTHRWTRRLALCGTRDARPRRVSPHQSVHE